MTVDFYDAHASEFCDRTEGLDLSHLYEPFLALVPPGGRILDAGCGSGRDARAFLRWGYAVTPMDASTAIVAEASRRLGLAVRHQRLEALDDVDAFEGVWACASLLHVAETDLDGVLGRLARALRPGGALYVSFKLGDGERVADDGRRFHDVTDEGLARRLTDIPALEVVRVWRTWDLRPDRSELGWVNALSVRR